LSEEIWQKLPQTEGYVVAQPYPKATDWADDAAARDEAGFIAQVIIAIRRTRSEFGVAPKDRIEVHIDASDVQQKWLLAHAPVLHTLARAQLTLSSVAPPKQAATELVEGASVTVPLVGLIDFAAETARLHKEQAKVEKELARIVAQLERADFLVRAPQDIVDEKNRQRADATQRLASIATALSRMA
jgi:valyl-tRNA synthetase